MKRFLQRASGLIVPQTVEQERDPLDKQADAATAHYGFTEGEREEYLKLQRRLAGNPRAMKQLVKRQRKFARAARMAPTIKSKP